MHGRKLLQISAPLFLVYGGGIFFLSSLKEVDCSNLCSWLQLPFPLPVWFFNSFFSFSFSYLWFNFPIMFSRASKILKYNRKCKPDVCLRPQAKARNPLYFLLEILCFLVLFCFVSPFGLPQIRNYLDNSTEDGETKGGQQVLTHGFILDPIWFYHKALSQRRK